MDIKTKWIDILYNIATSSRKVRNIFTPIDAFIYSRLSIITPLFVFFNLWELNSIEEPELDK